MPTATYRRVDTEGARKCFFVRHAYFLGKRLRAVVAFCVLIAASPVCAAVRAQQNEAQGQAANPREHGFWRASQ